MQFRSMFFVNFVTTNMFHWTSIQNFTFKYGLDKTTKILSAICIWLGNQLASPPMLLMLT